MGVPRFIAVLRNRYPTIFYRGVPTHVASLLLDMGGILHGTAQETFGYGDPKYMSQEKWDVLARLSPEQRQELYFNNVGAKILSIITAVGPIEYLFIAIDGPAPVGKTSQQQRRRYKATLPPLDIDPNAPKPPKFFESNSITPGTDFMMALDTFLQEWIVKNRSSLPVTVYYSSHREPGEGEHKIMREIRLGKIKGDDRYHVVYGLDADLLMLSLLSPLPKMLLMREDIGDVVHVEELSRVLKLNYPKRPRIVYDFVIMMMLVGNDFMPKLDSFRDMELAINTLLDLYEQRLDQDLTNEDLSINWTSLGKYITQLSFFEKAAYQLQVQQEFNFPSPLMAAAIKETFGKKYSKEFNLDAYRQLYYANEFYARGPQEAKNALTKLAGTDPFVITEDMIQGMSWAYLNTWNWVYEYYRSGHDAISQVWFYRYNHAPMLQDLTVFVQDTKNWVTSPNSTTLKDEQWQATKDTQGFGIWEQLLAVLPRKSAHLLPKKIQFFMSESSPIADMYPLTFEVERFNVNKEEESIPILPPTEVDRLKDTVQDYVQYLKDTDKNADQLLDKYAPTKMIAFEYNGEEREDFRRKREEQNKELVKQAFTNAARGRSPGYVSRGRGNSEPRGRGGYVPRGERGGYVPRGGDRGGYVPRGGDRGSYVPRGGERGGYAPRGTRGYVSRGARGARGRGQY